MPPPAMAVALQKSLLVNTDSNCLDFIFFDFMILNALWPQRILNLAINFLIPKRLQDNLNAGGTVGILSDFYASG